MNKTEILVKQKIQPHLSDESCVYMREILEVMRQEALEKLESCSMEDVPLYRGELAAIRKLKRYLSQ